MDTDGDLLSQDEIDSLLKGVSGDEDEDQRQQSVKGKTIQPFDPSTQARVVRGRLHALDIINERFARDFRMSLFNLIRRNADITVGAVTIQKYSEFTRNLPVPASLNLVGMKPLRGSALVVFPPNLVFLVVDSLFGGDGRFLAKSEGREFTHTEQRVIQRLLRLALDCYAGGWKNVYPLEMEFQRSEMQARFTNIASSPKELVVNTTFHLEVGLFGSDFQICMPFSMLEPIRDLLSGPMQKRDPEEQRQRVSRLSGEIKQSHVKLIADFTQIKSTLRQIQKLKVGDVLSMDQLPQEITAHVQEVPVLKCTYGSVNERKALRVTQVINHNAQAPFQEPEQ